MGRKLPMGVEVRTDVDLATYLPYRIQKLSVLTSSRDAQDRDNRTVKVREWRIIMILAAFGPLTLSEISQRLSADAASTTRGIQNLVKMELATSRTLKSDKRKQLITLTENGAATYDAIMPGRLAFSERILAPLDGAERAQFFRFIGLIEDNLYAMATAEDDPFADPTETAESE